MLNFKDRLDRLQELKEEEISITESIEEELNDFFLTLIMTYGSEKDGYIELPLDDLVISTEKTRDLEPPFEWHTQVYHLRKLSVPIAAKCTRRIKVMCDIYETVDENVRKSDVENVYLHKSFSLGERIAFAEKLKYLLKIDYEKIGHTNDDNIEHDGIV